MAITEEKIVFARIHSEIQQDDDDDHETNASDSSEKLELKIEEKNEAQNEDEDEDEDEEPKKDNNKPNQFICCAKNNGKANNKGDDVPDDKKDVNESIVTQWEVMKEYVPFIGILGWTGYLGALGEQFKNKEEKCDNFRIYIQWIYLLVCFIISFLHYMWESKLINDDLEYRQRLSRKEQVIRWRYVAGHVIVTILYLLTVSEQPFACHLPFEKKGKTLKISYAVQLSYLNVIRLTVVSLTTVTLKAFHLISKKKPDPKTDSDSEQDSKQQTVCCKCYV